MSIYEFHQNGNKETLNGVRKTEQNKTYLCTECVLNLGIPCRGAVTVCMLSLQGFTKGLHKCREEESTRGYCIQRPRKLLNCKTLDTRNVFKRNTPLSLTSGFRHCWRQDKYSRATFGLEIVLMFFFFFKVLVTFLFAKYHRQSLWHCYDTAANAFISFLPPP